MESFFLLSHRISFYVWVSVFFLETCVGIISSQFWLASALCMLSFNEHKLLILMKSSLSSFSFLVSNFSVLFKTYLPTSLPSPTLLHS